MQRDNDGVPGALGYINELSLKAVFLDPRYKDMSDFANTRGRTEGSNLRDQTIDAIRSELERLQGESQLQRDLSHENGNIEENGSVDEVEVEAGVVEDPVTWFSFSGRDSGRSRVPRTVTDERTPLFHILPFHWSNILVVNYIRTPYIAVDPLGEDDDIALAWWRRNRDSFPTLFKLALKYLSISASQANEERHVSAAGLVYNDLRQSLSPEVLHWILFCKLNWHLCTSL